VKKCCFSSDGLGDTSVFFLASLNLVFSTLLSLGSGGELSFILCLLEIYELNFGSVFS
jgi:hypothetical protein